MNAREHYAEAERLLLLATDRHPLGQHWIAQAQVHATLALASSIEPVIGRVKKERT